MAPKPKLSLIQPTSIPLDKLILSQRNVRQVKAGVSIEALADSIAHRSLLQSLSVRAVLDGKGKQTGMYEVQAGGRRLRALQLLVKQKSLAKDAPVPCIVKTGGIAEDDSLAENSDREALHPLDQFRAFAALKARGQSEDDIAAAFAVTPAIVRQRLKLASASPKLLEAYATDTLNLEQLMAFCVTDDHARQELILESIARREFSPNAWNIRRLLTETCVEATDPRVRFIGLDAYVAAGGSIMRDLFEEDDGGWLQDPELLMRLVGEKLAAEKDQILAQGWKWAEAVLEQSYERKRELRRLQPIADALSEEEQDHYSDLAEEHDHLIEGLSEDAIPKKVRARLDKIERALAELDNRPPQFKPEDIARAGVLLSVSDEGRLRIEYGFLRPEDATPTDQEEEDDGESACADAQDDGEATSEQDDAASSLPDRLLQDLTAFRTVALRDALGRNFSTAFMTVLHAFCLDQFYTTAASASCAQITARTHLPGGTSGLAEFPAAKSIEARHDSWLTRLPDDPSDLWRALAEMPEHDQADLFAHCVGRTVNAVREPHQKKPGALCHADALAAALALDMRAAGWATTAGNYLGRITKAQILGAVSEGKGESAAQLIAHLKKGDMAKEAERLLADTGWLPQPLRTAEAAVQSSAGDESAPAPAPLPAFLTDGAGEDAATHREAAE